MVIGMTSIQVNDPLAAFKFYTEVLGFDERMFMPEMRLAIVVAPSDAGGTGLLLEPNDHPLAKAYQTGLYAEGMPVIVFGTKDIQDEYERLTAKGVKFQQPPSPTPFGVEAVFDDTCGNFVKIWQAPG